MPDGLDSVRTDCRVATTGPTTGRAAAGTGRIEGPTLRRRPERAAGRTECVLPAGRRAGSVRPSPRSKVTDAQPGEKLDALHVRRRRDDSDRCVDAARKASRRSGEGEAIMNALASDLWPLTSVVWPVASVVQGIPSDTFYTGPPHFRWWIILYFFVGGISGGALL